MINFQSCTDITVWDMDMEKVEFILPLKLFCIIKYKVIICFIYTWCIWSELMIWLPFQSNLHQMFSFLFLRTAFYLQLWTKGYVDWPRTIKLLLGKFTWETLFFGDFGFALSGLPSQVHGKMSFISSTSWRPFFDGASRIHFLQANTFSEIHSRTCLYRGSKR